MFVSVSYTHLDVYKRQQEMWQLKKAASYETAKGSIIIL